MWLMKQIRQDGKWTSDTLNLANAAVYTSMCLLVFGSTYLKDVSDEIHRVWFPFLAHEDLRSVWICISNVCL